MAPKADHGRQLCQTEASILCYNNWYQIQRLEMNTSHATSQKNANYPLDLPRRQLLLGAGLGVAALVLAGCGSAPRRAAQVRQQPIAAPRRSMSIPNLPASSALQLDAAQREEAVARAMLAINTPYRYGGNTLETGFDCSGLVQYVFSGVSAGRLLPRSTIQWARASQPIDEGRLQRGDLVFFNTLGAAFSHMGIYIGGREFVHAPSSGKSVRVDSLDKTYFLTRFNGARTVFAA